MTEEDTIHLEFICPISKKIMNDPVMMPDGLTYDRQSIIKNSNANQVSPLTGQPLLISDAKPNYAIKSLIEKYMADNASEIQPIQQSSEVIPISFLEFFASFAESNHTDLLHITLKPNSSQRRSQISIIAMIDVSGSMDANACENVTGFEDVKLSRLQLVQHSLKTIVQTLTEQDSILFIAFNNSASIVLKWTKMNSGGKKLAMNAIEAFSAEGGTNIWDALRVGINEAVKCEKSASLLLFTDDEPNINPPTGIIPTLEDALSDINVKFTISTFSFGYQTDSKLMESIARIGNGIYGYCPDATMVGTIFINYLASLMTTLAQNVIVSVNGGSHKSQHIISLSANKAQNIFIEVPRGVAENIHVQVDVPSTNQKFSLSSAEKVSVDFPSLRNQIYRKKLINLIESNLDNIAQGQKNTLSLFKEMQNEVNPSDFMKKIMIDLVDSDQNHGQVQKSFEPNFYNKWGKDYLRSLMRFHILEQCGNFKDESLQLYATPQFSVVRKAANKIFINLPPPVPKTISQSKKISSSSSHSSYSPPPVPKTISQSKKISSSSLSSHSSYSPPTHSFHSPPTHSFHSPPPHSFYSPPPPHSSYSPPPPPQPTINMNRFYDSHGVCFDGDSFVEMKNGVKSVKELEKGDELKGGGRVVCLVEVIMKRIEVVVEIKGTLFTPYHPIKWKGEWVFPCNVGSERKKWISSWYNLVLSGSKAVRLNGTEAITLGHGMTEGVLSHPYFGTKAVVKALKKYSGYKEGRIVFLQPLNVVRDENGLISSFF